jgi:hypothetical protein
MKTQCEKIASHFKRVKYLTAMGAFNLGITSMHRRLTDMRRKGWVFGQEQTADGYNRYWVISKPGE